jgi:DNA-binding NarL/FixJ family response regulator
MAAVPLPDRRIRVVLADDHPLIRKMIRSTIQRHSHLELVSEAEDGAQAIELAKKLKPDVVVLNITMPVKNGFEAAREIKKQVPQAGIVILSTNADKYFVEEARKLGVKVFVAKSKAAEALVKAVESAAKGDDFIVVE